MVIRQLQNLLRETLSEAEPQDESSLQRRLHLAAAVLFTEVVHADHKVDEKEREAVRAALQATFGLSAEECGDLLDLAEQRVADVTPLHEFTSLVHRNFSYEQKVHVVEQMWRVVFADGVVDRYEEHLVRRAAELLYVSHRDFIRAKHVAQPR